MSKFQLHYWVSNGGDGSVGVRFVDSVTKAEADEKADFEEYNEPWGESSVSSVDLEVKDGKLFLLGSEYDDKTKKFKTTRTELKNK